MAYREEVARLIRTVVEPAAAAVDERGRFPRAAVAALAEAGIVGMTMSRAVGGGGQGLREAGEVVELLARVCGGTATVLRSHFAAVAVLDVHGDRRVRADVAAGAHLSTLALFDRGPGRDFLTPPGAAVRRGGVVTLHGRKEWVISAGEADSHVWSSRSLSGAGPATLWLVPGDAPGLLVPADHGGIGLRGSCVAGVLADPVRIPAGNLLGADGDGGQAVLDLALPWFEVLGASVALGLMEGVIAASAAQAGAEPGAGLRADLARMRLRTDSVRVVHDDALAAASWDPAGARHKLFQLTLAAADGVVAVTDLAMKVCGDAAFRRDLGIERRFRDARAAAAIEPTTDTVLDFAGRTTCALPAL